MSKESFNKKVKRLVERAGFDGLCRIEPICGGANNRVFKVTCGDGVEAFLKAYFQHPCDTRNRLNAEFSFCRFAWDCGVRRMPRPLARDDENMLGLYEFIRGDVCRAGQIGEDEMRQALEFYNAVNEHRASPAAACLPTASEACFSVSEHVNRVHYRVHRLVNMGVETEQDAAAREFVEHRLRRRWNELVVAIRRKSCEGGVSLQRQIGRGERCLSPSDFGFHNAIVSADSSLKFIDFEYAGWDDPAKLVCDFFCQPAVPVPIRFYDVFSRAVAGRLAEPGLHLRRMALLLPVYQVKWCCILLNDFVAADSARRRFARGHDNIETAKTNQLEKAKAALENVMEPFDEVLTQAVSV